MEIISSNIYIYNERVSLTVSALRNWAGSRLRGHVNWTRYARFSCYRKRVFWAYVAPCIHLILPCVATENCRRIFLWVSHRHFWQILCAHRTLSAHVVWFWHGHIKLGAWRAQPVHLAIFSHGVHHSHRSARTWRSLQSIHGTSIWNIVKLYVFIIE